MGQKATIIIEMDEHGNLETRSNVALLEQQKELLNMAIRTLGTPKVYVGVDLGKKEPDKRR